MYIRRYAIALLMTLMLPLQGGEVLDKIVENMAEISSLKSDFRQEKRLRSFAFPLKITGSMYIEHSAERFAWIVKEPMKSRCIIRGNTLEQWDGDSGKVVTIDGNRNDALKALFSTLRQLFAGDIKKMMKDFKLEKESNPMILAPKSGTPAEALIKKITLRFSPDWRRIEAIVLDEKNGDTTTIEFINTQINVKIEESVWQAVPARQ